MRSVAGGRNGPWTGVTWHQGAFYVAEGGQLEGGRILRIDRDGSVRVLLEGLPSQGDHHTNGPVVGPEQWGRYGCINVENTVPTDDGG